MKKIIITAVLLLSFSGANAQVVDMCSNISGVQTSVPSGHFQKPDNTCHPQVSNGNPYLVTQAWGLTGVETAKVNAGSAVTDENGFSVSDACPLWQRTYCSDLTKTDYYRESMKALAKQLLANGWASQFPQFKGWYAVVR